MSDATDAGGYVELPLETDWEALRTEAILRLGKHPEWNPSDHDLEVAGIAESSQFAAVLNAQAQLMARAAFRELGDILQVPPIDGTPASAPTTWTLREPAGPGGQTIPAGTVVAFEDVELAWLVVDDIVFAPGIVEAAAVTIIARNVGEAYNDLPAQDLILIDQLAFVASVASTAPTAGGADAETTTEYLDRLAQRQRLRPTRPLFASDYAAFARDVAGVHRARGLDNYDPATATFDNEGMMTLFNVDDDGQPLDLIVKASLDAFLEGQRRVNDVIFLEDPVYTPVDVAFTATALPDVDIPAVEAAAIAGVEQLLHPGRWAGGDQEPPQWRDEDLVGHLEVAHAIRSTPGIARVDSVLLNGVAADVVLAGPVGLPAATVAGVVT